LRNARQEKTGQDLPNVHFRSESVNQRVLKYPHIPPNTHVLPLYLILFSKAEKRRTSVSSKRE